MKIKVNIAVFIDIFVKLSERSVYNIADYQNFLIVDFVKNEKINLLKKIEAAKDARKQEISIKISRATSTALYHFLIAANCDTVEQKLNYSDIAGQIHKKLIDSLSIDFETFELPESENLNQLQQ